MKVREAGPVRRSGGVRSQLRRPARLPTGGASVLPVFGLLPGEIIVDHFAGGGGASTGVGFAAGRSPDIAINHDREAIRMHSINHPETRHYTEDIWEVDPVEVCEGREVGLLWTSPTCFPAGTLVFTSKGQKPIEDVVVGDDVLTHKTRWRKVVAVTSKESETVVVRGQGHYGLETTPDHPFYSKKITKRWPRGESGQGRRPGLVREIVENPYWPIAETMAGKLWATPTCFADASVPICQSASFSDDFFYLVGRWLGDGFTSKGDVVICTGADDFSALRTIFRTRPLTDERGEAVAPRVQAADTPAPKLAWGNAVLARWLGEHFGTGCESKELPAWVLSMQESWRRALLEGYADADGCTTGSLISTSSVSKSLSIGIRLLAASLGYAPCMYHAAGREGEIGGRRFLGRDSYKVSWRDDSQKQTSFRDTSHVFTLVKEVCKTKQCKTVYCLQVDEDESYVADGIVVHNCTHFSHAKGDALSEESIKLRTHAWVTIRWAAAVRPRIICLENVPEFRKWGPLHRRHSDSCQGQACQAGCLHGTKKKNRRGRGLRVTHHSPGCPGRACSAGCEIYKPIKARQGQTFDAFVERLRKLGYAVDWWFMTACDYGAPTTRRRLILVARCDGQPITRPAPTHGPGREHPHRSAAECIDWRDLGRSIFDEDGNTRHADKTLARLAAGVRKFVLGNPRPFLVPTSYGRKGSQEDRTRSVDDPMRTVCGNRGSHALVTPVVFKAKTYGGGNSVKSAEDPLGAVTCSKRGEHVVASAVLVRPDAGQGDEGVEGIQLRVVPGGRGRDEAGDEVEVGDGGVDSSASALAAAYLVTRSYGEREGQAPRVSDVRRPLTTVVSGGIKCAAAAALLIKHNGGNNDLCGAAGQVVTRPLDTISTRDTKALAAVSLTRYNGVRDGHAREQEVDESLSTVDTSRRHALTAACLLKMRGTSDAHVASSASSAEEPVPTISAQGSHVAAVSAFLLRYNGGTNLGQEVSDPAGTLTQKPRFALVTIWIDGEEWVVADIYMRMLRPDELFAAQGFPPSYVIAPELDGRPMSKTAQIRMCGNSVPPQMAEAVVRAQLWGTSLDAVVERAVA